MIKSIISGAPSTPTLLAKEIVFAHGEYAVIAFGRIIGASGVSLTERESAQVKAQVVKILARVARDLNHGEIRFDSDAALKRINENNTHEGV